MTRLASRHKSDAKRALHLAILLVRASEEDNQASLGRVAAAIEQVKDAAACLSAAHQELFHQLYPDVKDN